MELRVKDTVSAVDEADAELVGQYRWTPLRVGTITYLLGARRGGSRGGQKVLIHRLILGVSDPDIQVDHVDHDGLNNRRSNLRACTASQNQANARKPRRTAAGRPTSRYKGVCADGRGRWRAQVQFGGRQVYLGSFATPERAALAYDLAARHHFGPFAMTNEHLYGPYLDPRQVARILAEGPRYAALAAPRAA